MDGLGLVYEKQGNTGAAAYNNPVYQIGNNPLDQVAAQIGQEVQQVKKTQALDKAAKDKANQDALNFDISGWDFDNKAYFTQATSALKQKGAQLLNDGHDINDYSDPKVMEWRKQQKVMTDAAKASTNQGAIYDKLIAGVNGNRDKYDYDKSVAGLNQYMQMSPVERLNVNPADFLVEKEKPFDAYAPVADVDISKYIDKNTFGNPNVTTSSSTLNKTNLKKTITDIANNPLNEEHYQIGLEKNLWKDKQDYARQQYEHKAAQAAKDYSRVVHAPKTDSKTDSNGDGIIDQTAGGQLGVQYPLTYDYKTKSMVPTLGQNVVQLGPINAVVSGNDAWTVDGNKRLGKAANIISGTLSTPFVLTNGNVAAIPFDPNDPNKQLSYSVYNKTTGKVEPYDGTYEEIVSKLINAKLGEFRPMVYGQYKSSEGGTESYNDVWAKAETVMNGSDKNIANALPAYNQLLSTAKEMTNKYRTATPAKPASKPAATNKPAKPPYLEWKKSHPNGNLAEWAKS